MYEKLNHILIQYLNENNKKINRIIFKHKMFGNKKVFSRFKKDELHIIVTKNSGIIGKYMTDKEIIDQLPTFFDKQKLSLMLGGIKNEI